MTRLAIRAATIAIAAGFSLAVASAALAAGDPGNADSSSGIKCPEGKVWDPKAGFFGTGKCVDAAELKKDDSKKPVEKQGLIYDQGKVLAKAEQYEAAIAMLLEAPDQTDPRVLNYLGYSSRKLGRMDEALAYYHAAVKQNPDFSLVREYLGEAYIQLGLLEKAREQLTEIERICGGRSCEEYTDLAELMVDGQIKE